MQIKLATYLLTTLFLGLIPVMAVAQEALKPDERSTLAFDIRVDKLLASAKELGLAEMTDMEPDFLPPFMRDVKITDIQRIYGQFNFKQDMAMFMMGPDQVPFEMFVRVRFTSPDVADKVFQNLKRTGSTTEINGVTYLIEDDDNDNMMVFQSDMSELEMASKKYMLQKDRKLMSPKLQSIWKNIPNTAIRLAVDLDGNQKILSQLVEMGKQNSDPTAGAFFDLVDNMDGAIFAADLNSADLVMLELFGKSDSEATELKEGLDGLISLGKMAAGPMLNSVAKEQAEVGRVGKSTLAGLAATQNGNKVRVAIKRPDGFDKMVQGAVASAASVAKKANRLNNFRQLALGILNYESAYRKFPFPTSGIGNADLSWRMKILPFIEQNQMYEQMDVKAGPTDAANAQFADKMPKIFGEDGKSSNVAWIVSKVNRFAGITDGSSNTIMLLEHPQGQPWLNANGLTPEEAVKLVQGLKDGEDLAAVFYDGSSRFLNNKIPADSLKWLFMPNDGQRIDWDAFGGR